MEQKVKPSPRLAPLPADHIPELGAIFEATKQRMGFVPNSMLIMQRKPRLVKAFAELGDAVRSDLKIDRMLMSLISHVASRAAGCLYCMAHTAEGAAKAKPEKLEAVWEYRTSPLFTEAERVALDFAVAAASVPNGVTDDMFAELRKYYTEEQVLDIVAVISLFGWLNRWNDTMGTPLEDEPIEYGERYLGPHGWTPGKHAPR
ncbi:MAG: hypothetical protein A3G25_13110 [Betaproteobacteria bacterium RIFCSPLOWO2_12_FULL_63_13]|nr:MAG: hypothetical protein A3H32_04635 [Betaproteobacteria bacterium RIFCSPLOWO2_02_FULL_63_19]OGA48739.1 MAG: hypothetical protein A3G25_13110 [Betaproteobacteria bacterium RIFCSPLOWO2_12_FULL_63_13]